MDRVRASVPVLSLGFLLALAVTNHGAPAGSAPASGAGQPTYVPGELLIKFKPEAGPAVRAAALAELDAENLRTFLSRAENWRLGPGISVEEAVERMRANPLVDYAEPNYLVSLDIVPNDPRLGELWGLINTGQSGGTADADVDAELAWNVSTGSSDVLVGVIDTGVDYNHPDLAANIWTNPGEIPGNGVDDDGNGFVDDVHGYDFVNEDGDPFDDHGHGTHVSGTIGAIGNNGVGVVGVNWQVKIMALKFLNSSGSGTTANAIRAVDYSVLMGVDLTSNSWGGGAFSQALYDAIANANAHEMAFVAAAGNNGTNNDVSPHYPSNYDLPNVIAVAATDRNDLKASFSNYGPLSVDLGAPGVDILSTLPGNSYGLLSGTSMATPHVAGTCALIRAVSPNIPVGQMKSVLLNSVDPIPSMQGIVVSNGRLNAFRSIAEPDTTPPGAILDLAVVDPGSNTMGLSWTATGDDGSIGTATFYEARYSTSPITDEASWASATRAGNEPAPLPSGAAQGMEVRNLASSTLYYFAVRAFDEWGNAGPVSNLASGTTLPSPTAQVEPTSVSDELQTGQQSDHAITLTNVGVGTLDFTIPTPSVGQPMSLPQEPLELGKDDPDPRQGDPVTDNRGGPDGFGYRWIDSDEPGGPAFDWTDISATGMPLGLVNDDQTTAPIALGFNFPFYGTFFDSIRVCTNGWISFTSGSTAFSNQPLPNSGAPENLIAPFWDDLHPRGVNRTFFQSFGNRAIVQWQAIERYSGAGSYTFQVILESSGAITFQYLASTGAVDSATVGIQDATRTVGLQVAFNQLYVHDDLAVRIAAIPQWLTVSPTSGRLRAGESALLNLHMDASGLEGGTYPGQVNIQTNDPDRPILTVDASLHVIGAPDARVQPTSLDYGDSFVGFAKSATLIVANDGTDTLHVSDIVSSHPAELVASPTSFEVPPHGSRNVTVTWTPSATGPFSGSLTVLSDDAGEPSIVVPVGGNGIPAPVMVVDPTSFSETLFTGQQITRPLAVTNTGGSDLVITAQADQGTGGGGLVWQPEEGSAGSGGPDAFGYRWKDSDAPGGPSFQWVDISGTGTQIFGTNVDDSLSATINMGLTFPFYGNSFSSVKVSSNGWLTFDTTYTGSSLPTNGTLPSTSLPRNSIAFFWDDLHTRTGNVKYLNDGTRFIVQFTNVGRFTPSTGQSYTFQVQLYPNGRILIQYLTMAGTLNSATIGIQDQTRTIALLVNFNANYVHNNLALQISRTPDWLTVSPGNATIPPGGSFVFTVGFDSTERQGGVLEGAVVLNTNIPTQPQERVPARLTVIGAPVIGLVPASFDYGTRFTGYSHIVTFQVVNTGTDVLNVLDTYTTDPSLVVQEPPGAGGGEESPAAAFPVPPGGSRLLELRWSPAAPGTLDAQVHVLSDDPATPDKVMPVTGVAVAPPVAVWSPGSFTEALDAGDVVHRSLRLENRGGSDLTFDTTITLQSGATVPVYEELDIKKEDESDPRPGVLGMAGPDSFGYRWRDSDQAGGPVFDWVDIRATGTPVAGLNGDDQNVGPIPIGFPFPFYGNVFTSVRVGSNGFLSFTDTSTDLSNDPLPNTGSPANLLAVFHDDLHFRGVERARYLNDGSRFILQYTNVDRFSTGSDLTFQVILYPSGRIVYQYLSMSGVLDSATVGIQNATKTDGLTVVFNAAYVHDNLAIQFEPPFVYPSVSPRTGTVPPGGAVDLDVQIDATGLNGGDYQSSIDLATNDPANALVRVPLSVHVTGIPDIAADPGSVSFPMTFVGFTRSSSLTIRNTGTDVLLITGVSTSGDFSQSGLNPPVSLPVGGTIPVTVTFAPTLPGTHQGTLEIASDDPDEAPFIVGLQGSALIPPEIGVAPAEIRAILPPAQSGERTLTIGNTGGSDLDWEAGTNIVSSEGEPGSYLELGKEEADPREGSLGAGGPDAFGYRWRDSDQPGGPVFDWVEISGIGTPIAGLTGDDQTATGIPIGFPFPFYGNSFSTVNVCTNGWLSFTSTLTSFTNQTLPNTGAPENLLAPFWDDLHFRGSVHAYYYSDGTRFIVQYNHVDRFATGSDLTFQVILYPNGRIVYQYLNMSGVLNSATIGIQNAARTIGLSVVFNAAYVHDNLAIEFRKIPTWVTVSPTSGTVPEASSQDVSVTLDSTDLEHGVHESEIRFSSNDPYRPVVVVPVQLAVNRKPVAVAGPPQTLECTGNQTAATSLDGTGSSDPDADPLTFSWSAPGIVFDDPASRTPSATFPLGQTVASLVVNDGYEDSEPDTVTITVQDTTPPVFLSCPQPVVVECQSNLQALVALPPASATDSCHGTAAIANSHTSGGPDASGSYGLGVTVVTFTATDGSGNQATCETTVTVVDTTSPTISAAPTPDLLWPPNHRMSTVRFDVIATDACDPAPAWVLMPPVSSEPDDAQGGGDGHTTDDIQDASTGTSDTEILLRAERDGNGSGRTYTVGYRVTDVSGNTTSTTAEVFVPHDMGDVVEPLDLHLEGAQATTLSWGTVTGALHYDVIRGDLANLRASGSNIDLGPVVCIERQSLDTTTAGHEDRATPQPGKAFFYLVQFYDGVEESSYGSESAGRARVIAPGNGDCP